MYKSSHSDSGSNNPPCHNDSVIYIVYVTCVSLPVGINYVSEPVYFPLRGLQELATVTRMDS